MAWIPPGAMSRRPGPWPRRPRKHPPGGRLAHVLDSGRTGSGRHSFLLLLCLGAVLTGIIGMHLWMGGNGEHGDSQAAATSISAGTPATGITAVGSDVPSLHHGTGAPGDGFPMPGCVGTGDADDMAAGMCVLSLIVLAMFVFLLPPRHVLPGSFLRRGPPRVSDSFRLVPTPSLTQLCISRT